VRRGRKAAGLLGKMAELPKDESSIAWLFFGKSAKVAKRKEVNNQFNNHLAIHFYCIRRENKK
jgi:hypothetical protein